MNYEMIDKVELVSDACPHIPDGQMQLCLIRPILQAVLMNMYGYLLFKDKQDKYCIDDMPLFKFTDDHDEAMLLDLHKYIIRNPKYIQK